MNTTFFRGLLGLVLLLTSAAFAWAANDPELSGRIVFADGTVTANGRVVDTGDLLVGPQILKTGKASVVEIVFGGRNVFRLGPDTVAKVDFSVLKKTVELNRGEFTSVLKKLVQVPGDSSFLLKTPTANAGVRGTSFHVTTDGANTYFCTCNGSIALDNGSAKESFVVTAAHHSARQFTKAPDGTVSVSEAPMVGHTDGDLESLAKRIGYTEDWSQPDLKHSAN